LLILEASADPSYGPCPKREIFVAALRSFFFAAPARSKHQQDACSKGCEQSSGHLAGCGDEAYNKLLQAVLSSQQVELARPLPTPATGTNPLELSAGPSGACSLSFEETAARRVTEAQQYRR
jgi:hypothetical protein